MFVGGIMDKKERCVDCTRPVWDGHESMKLNCMKATATPLQLNTPNIL